MEKESSDNNELDGRISELNIIFEELILDAKGFSEDFVSGIYVYFILAAMSILSGIQTIWSNRFFIIKGDYLPLALATIVIFSGFIILFRGFILKQKYTRFFEARKKLEKL